VGHISNVNTDKILLHRRVEMI